MSHRIVKKPGKFFNLKFQISMCIKVTQLFDTLDGTIDVENLKEEVIVAAEKRICAQRIIVMSVHVYFIIHNEL